MAYAAVSREAHSRRRWRRYQTYEFARELTIVDVALAESARLCLTMPMAFRQAGDQFVPIALMGVEPKRNVLVAPDHRWLGHYIPALIRCHPFMILPDANGQLVLCVDQASVTEGEGEAFFDAEGAPSPAMQTVVDVLQQIEGSRRAARIVADSLAKLGLLKPLSLEPKAGAPAQTVEGIFAVDEGRLDALADAEFVGLRATGAIRLAHYQGLSLLQWPQLLALAGQHRAHREALSAQAAAIYRPQDDGDLQIDWSRFTAPP